MTNSSTPPARVGLIGLGLMGRGIGHSLLRRGHALSILAHRRREVAEELVAAGANEVGSAAELAQACEVVVLCVSSAAATEQCLFGPGGVIESGRSGLLVIESSTLTPADALAFSARLKEQGMDLVDAPVTRGPREAMEGRLNALIGGDERAVQRALPVLSAFCERSFVLGDTGSGYAAKLVSNFIAFSNLVAVAEGMATAVQAGLHLPTLLDAMAVSGSQNRVLDGLTPWLRGATSPRSLATLTTAHKDLSYYLDFARSLGTQGAHAEAVKQALQGAMDAGMANEFTPAYLELVATRMGVNLDAARHASG